MEIVQLYLQNPGCRKIALFQTLNGTLEGHLDANGHSNLAILGHFSALI